MNQIQILPPSVYEKIKAGEVVEDPASVVRELLDNAIDAGAKNILVEVEEGGLSFIRVKDDGSGMSENDLKISFHPHTTSKIKNFEDIFHLKTVGFRGEALASIAKVAFLKIVCSDNDSGMGFSIYAEGGSLIRESGEAHAKGTSIEVTNLFYNVPVRRNFIKSPVKENRKIKEEIIVRAISYPDINFTLKVNKNVVAQYHSKEWEKRLREIFKEHNEDLLPFTHRQKEVSIKGMITKLNTTFSNTSNLYFYVNNRYLKPRFFYGVINSVFSSLIPKGRYPGGAVFVYVDPSHIDPNIHPSKKEVKIFIEDFLYRQLYHVLRKLFYKEDNKEQGQSFYFDHKYRAENKGEKKKSFKKSQDDLSLDFYSSDIHKEEQISGIHYQYIGTVFSTYVIIERHDDLLFIDFHAAHERLRYEKLKKNGNPSETVSLLTPRIINFKISDIEKITQSKEKIRDLGFDFHLFGQESIVVRGIPVFYKDMEWEKDFQDIVSDIGEKEVTVNELRDHILKSVACRGSYMSGGQIPKVEAEILVRLVLEEKIPLTCPHGRPFVFTLTKKELASHFLRGK